MLTLVGPNRLVIVLDRSEVIPDNPGDGTPAMVYRHFEGLGEQTATYWCAQWSEELLDARGRGHPLTDAEVAWLETQEDTITEYLYGT